MGASDLQASRLFEGHRRLWMMSIKRQIAPKAAKGAERLAVRHVGPMVAGTGSSGAVSWEDHGGRGWKPDDRGEAGWVPGGG